MILHVLKNKGSDRDRQANLEILPETREDLQTQIARIKQTIEKVLDEDKSFAERIQILFREQSIRIISILSSLSMIISTIARAITCVVGGGVRPTASGLPLPKDERALKKWLTKLANAIKRLTRKAAIVGSVVGAILSFLGKAVGFVAEHISALIFLLQSWMEHGWCKKWKSRYDTGLGLLFTLLMSILLRFLFICPHSSLLTFFEVARIKYWNMWYLLAFAYNPFVKTGSFYCPGQLNRSKIFFWPRFYFHDRFLFFTVIVWIFFRCWRLNAFFGGVHVAKDILMDV